MAVGVNDEISGFAEVASLLWTEREILERVLFKVVEEQLVVAAGHTRWLPSTNREIEAALGDLRRTEVERATEVDAVAKQLDLPPACTLTELAHAAPQPWDEIIREHRVALVGLMSEINAATSETRRLLDAGGRAVGEALQALHGGSRLDLTSSSTDPAPNSYSLNGQA